MLCRLFILLAVFTGCAEAKLLLLEDFEDSDTNYQLLNGRSEFSDGSGDFLTRSDGSNISSAVNYTAKSGQFFFAAMDLNGEGGSGSAALLFNNIEVTGFEQLYFSGLFAEDDASNGLEDWDSNSQVRISAQLDAGPEQTLLSFTGQGATNTEPGLDTNFDGIADGTKLSQAFSEFTANIQGSGAWLSLRIDILNLDAGDEDIAFDNISIYGQPSSVQVSEPNTLSLFLLLVSLLLLGSHSRLKRASQLVRNKALKFA